MPQAHRREALTDAAMRARGVDQSVFAQITLRGTHAWGAYYGSERFPQRFAGTPVVMLTYGLGSSSQGKFQALRVVNRYSGSFTYQGSPNHGTFHWMAWGSGQVNY